MNGRRVIHKKYGAGEIIDQAFIGPRPVSYVKFDSEKEEVIVPDSELEPEIKIDIGNDHDRRAAKEKELEEIRIDGLAEIKEIEEMNNETLIEGFEYIIRSGAGPGVRRVVFMKREILKRMNKAGCL